MKKIFASIFGFSLCIVSSLSTASQKPPMYTCAGQISIFIENESPKTYVAQIKLRKTSKDNVLYKIKIKKNSIFEEFAKGVRLEDEEKISFVLEDQSFVGTLYINDPLVKFNAEANLVDEDGVEKGKPAQVISTFACKF